MTSAQLAVSAFAVLVLLAAAPAARAIDGAVIAYGLTAISPDGFQRILDADSMKYICVQEILSRKWDSTATRNRAEQLRKANKRIVLQLWWGPCADFPWSKYSFPNIARDPTVRADFFRDVVDPAIAAYGAENLYGVHLLEETGMQFGTDVGPRENPDDFATFKEHSNSYGAPFYSGWGDPSVGGVHIANVRRHEKDFTRMTGLKFAYEPKWGANERFLFDRWISRRLQSEAQVEFAKHIHKKYPRIKAFTWDLINSAGENPRTDQWLEAKHFDGVIADPYGNTGSNFYWLRAYRTIYPKAEIIAFAMGGMGDTGAWAYANADAKRARATAAYLAGVDVFGFFEYPMDFERPEAWKVNTEILDKLTGLPRFQKKSKILLISDGLSDVYSYTLAWTGLKFADFVPTWEAHGVDFSKYEVVILHSNGGNATFYWDSDAVKGKYGLPGWVDYREIDRFVAKGGLLVLSGQTKIPQECKLFLAREGYLYTSESADSTPITVNIPRENRRSLSFSAVQMPVTHDSKRVEKTNAGYFAQYGQGAVLFFPYLRQYDPAEPYTSQQWQDYRRLLKDTPCNALKRLGKPNLALDYFGGHGISDYSLQATSDDGNLTGVLLLDNWLELCPPSGWKVKGHDLLTGTEAPVLSKDRTAAVIVKR